jgi:predicted DNA repair protein MutK
MAGGLVGLLDDVAALAKLAAASIDDVGAAAGRASMKAAGLMVDDTAVTPTYVHGIAAERELPIIKRIAKGSIRNKLLFILPAALILSEFLPTVVEIILIAGGTFLCFEGAHKIIHAIRGDDHDHDVPAAVKGPGEEESTVAGAIRTDLILSGEIMVIALKEVIEEPIVTRGAVLVVVAILVTIVVFGLVALIVKMDDVGLMMTQQGSRRSERIGRGLVSAMPKVLTFLTVVGTAAMLWVGGHILVAGAHELGWDWPYDVIHDAEAQVEGVGGVGGFLTWLVNTAISAAVGLAWGCAAMAAGSFLPFGKANHDVREPATD